MNTRIFKNHDNFESHIEDVIRYGQEIIADLPFKGNKPSKEKAMLLEALLLRSCALWESFLEQECIELIYLDTTQIVNELELDKKNKLNLKLIRAIVFSDHYRDFHEIDRAINFFKKMIITKYNIFLCLSDEQKKKINFSYLLRNYLSHYSEFSKKKLFDGFKKNYKYSQFIEPGRFLLKNNGEHFEKLVHNFTLVSVQMRSRLMEQFK